jgi:hypothetical protein
MHRSCNGNLNGRMTEAEPCSSPIGDGFRVKLV